MDKDVFAMSDAEIDAALGADDLGDVTDLDTVQDDADEAGEAVTTTDAEPPAEQDQQEQPSEQTDPNWNPEGPGDIRKALQAEREQAKALKAELAELQQWRQQQQQAEMQARAQAEEAQRQELRRQQLEESTFDPEAQERLLNQWRYEDAQRIQQQAQQQHVQALYQQGFDLGREAFPDFDAVLNRGLADPELAPVLESIANQALMTGKNPTIAAYKAAKRFDPEAQKAAIEAEVQRQVQAVLQKQQKPATAGATTIAHASSAVPGLPEPKAPRRLSDRELDAKLAEQAG